MRYVVVAGLLLLTGSAALAKPRTYPRPPVRPVAFSPLKQTEDRAERAQREQQQRYARFDERVRKATGSICDGCLAKPTYAPRSMVGR